MTRPRAGVAVDRVVTGVLCLVFLVTGWVMGRSTRAPIAAPPAASVSTAVETLPRCEVLPATTTRIATAEDSVALQLIACMLRESDAARRALEARYQARQAALQRWTRPEGS